MLTRACARVYAAATLFAALVLVATPADAQYRPRPLNDPATGETFHIEGSIGFWNPTAKIVIASEALGIVGDDIDFQKDLGLTDKRLPEVQLVLRPFRSHKLRFQYIPIIYDQSATPTRSIVFNGQRYQIGFPVASTLSWKAYRFSYEYDFIVTNRGFGGFILETKYTDVTAQLTTAALGPVPSIDEFARARAPIPALGGIARVYVVPNISITGEVTGFKLPASIDKRYSAHYVDVDVYGTVNFTNNIGAQMGYRVLDVGYLIKTDSGSMTLRGLYFGVVARY